MPTWVIGFGKFLGSKLGIGLMAGVAILALLTYHKLSIVSKDTKIAASERTIDKMKDDKKIEDLQQQVAVSDALLQYSQSLNKDLITLADGIQAGDKKILEDSKTQRAATTSFVKTASAPTTLKNSAVAEQNLTKMQAYVTCLQSARTTGARCAAPQ